MAEIPVERRKKRSIWPWIIGLFVVGLLIWMLTDNNDVVVEDGTAYNESERYESDRQMLTDGQNQDLQTRQGDGKAQEFVQFVEERNGEISKSHEYVQQGLTYLADALDDLYNRLGPDAEKSDAPDQIRKQARQLTKGPSSTQHANVIRDAFTTAANAIQNLQATYFSDKNRNANDMVETARKIEGNELATNQGEKIEEFFEQAANSVEEMSNEIVEDDTQTRTGDPGLNPQF